MFELRLDSDFSLIGKFEMKDDAIQVMNAKIEDVLIDDSILMFEGVKLVFSRNGKKISNKAVKMSKNIKEYHAVKVSFLSATNTKGARVKMKIGGTSKTIPFNHFFNSDTEIAIDYLENIKGVKIEGVTCVNGDVFLLLNNLIIL